MTSVLNVDTIADKAGTGPVGLTKQSAAKAWCNLDTSGTTAFRDSFNCSSATDSATGRNFATLTNNMTDANQAMFMSSANDTSNGWATRGIWGAQVSSSVMGFLTGTYQFVETDQETVTGAYHGDLA